MRTFYFDIKDGVPVRDRLGIEFASPGAAIDHSKEVARRLSEERTLKDPNLFVAVVNESGAEIHREPVYPVNAEISVGKSG